MDLELVRQTWRELGPYCVVDIWSPDAAWRPLRELIDSPGAAVERVEHMRTVLAGRSRVRAADIEERASASLVFLGLTARLTSPLLASAVVRGAVPAMTVDTLWWRAVDTGPWPMAWSDDALTECAADGLPDLLVERLLAIAVPLAEAFGSAFGLSQQVLRGNITSSLGGSMTVLNEVKPSFARAATDLVERVLASPQLTGTADLHVDATDRPFLIRSSCCLFYRVPGGGTCGDCVLTRGERLGR